MELIVHDGADVGGGGALGQRPDGPGKVAVVIVDIPQAAFDGEAQVAGLVIVQGQGLAGINEATSLMTSYFDPATKLCYAIGAVLGLVGGIKTYGKFSSGDPDTSKTAASWFFACIFLIVAATILRSFFL